MRNIKGGERLTEMYLKQWERYAISMNEGEKFHLQFTVGAVQYVSISLLYATSHRSGIYGA